MVTRAGSDQLWGQCICLATKLNLSPGLWGPVLHGTSASGCAGCVCGSHQGMFMRPRVLTHIHVYTIIHQHYGAKDGVDVSCPSVLTPGVTPTQCLWCFWARRGQLRPGLQEHNSSCQAVALDGPSVSKTYAPGLVSAHSACVVLSFLLQHSC